MVFGYILHSVSMVSVLGIVNGIHSRLKQPNVPLLLYGVYLVVHWSCVEHSWVVLGAPQVKTQYLITDSAGFQQHSIVQIDRRPENSEWNRAAPAKWKDISNGAALLLRCWQNQQLIQNQQTDTSIEPMMLLRRAGQTSRLDRRHSLGGTRGSSSGQATHPKLNIGNPITGPGRLPNPIHILKEIPSTRRQNAFESLLARAHHLG